MKKGKFSFNIFMAVLFIIVTLGLFIWEASEINYKVKSELAKSKNPVSIKEMENQELWRGIVTGNIFVVGGLGLVEVVNPSDNPRIFRLRVLYSAHLARAKDILKYWKVGQEILFYKVGVFSSDSMKSSMFSYIGLFVSMKNWETITKDSFYHWKIANPPDR